ncbi:hypothetical protein DPEC_G00361770 [Dallia pectoralis]|nr:hypothetical protein DPEC_G00361770 [Dallia pectoralis]
MWSAGGPGMDAGVRPPLSACDDLIPAWCAQAGITKLRQRAFPEASCQKSQTSRLPGSPRRHQTPRASRLPGSQASQALPGSGRLACQAPRRPAPAQLCQARADLSQASRLLKNSGARSSQRLACQSPGDLPSSQGVHETPRRSRLPERASRLPGRHHCQLPGASPPPRHTACQARPCQPEPEPPRASQAEAPRRLPARAPERLACQSSRAICLELPGVTALSPASPPARAPDDHRLPASHSPPETQLPRRAAHLHSHHRADTQRDYAATMARLTPPMAAMHHCVAAATPPVAAATARRGITLHR